MAKLWVAEGVSLSPSRELRVSDPPPRVYRVPIAPDFGEMTPIRPDSVKS